MQIWKDSKYAFQEKQGRGKAIRKISRLYRVFSIEGFPKRIFTIYYLHNLDGDTGKANNAITLRLPFPF